LKEVTITEFREPVFEKNREQGRTFDASEIRNLGTRDVRAVQAITPGVYSGDKGGELSVRAGRSAGTAYYIDGVKVRGTPNLPEKGKMKVIIGGTPAEYGNFNKGEVSIEKTKKQKQDIQQEPIPTSNENYSLIVENQFKSPKDEPLSTFSADVDRAAYSNIRRFIRCGARSAKRCGSH
jgi:hypothetical protein